MTRKIRGMQRTFVREFLATGNATTAAQRAGYAQPGSSGARLLKTASVAAVIEKHQQKANQAAQITRDEVLAIMGEHVRAALTDYLDADGEVDLEKLRTVNPHAVAEYQMTAHGPRLKLHSPVRAAERIARMLGWDMPTKIAPTDPNGENPYQAVSDETLVAMLEKVARK